MHIVSIFGIKNMFYEFARKKQLMHVNLFKPYDMNEIDMQHVCSNSMVLNILVI